MAERAGPKGGRAARSSAPACAPRRRPHLQQAHGALHLDGRLDGVRNCADLGGARAPKEQRRAQRVALGRARDEEVDDAEALVRKIRAACAGTGGMAEWRGGRRVFSERERGAWTRLWRATRARAVGGRGRGRPDARALSARGSLRDGSTVSCLRARARTLDDGEPRRRRGVCGERVARRVRARALQAVRDGKHGGIPEERRRHDRRGARFAGARARRRCSSCSSAVFLAWARPPPPCKIRRRRPPRC